MDAATINGVLGAVKAAARARVPALGVIQWYAEGPVAAAQKAVTSGHRAVVKASAGGYVNYVEAGRSVNSYYGTSLSRLHAAKKKYDRSNFFRTPYTFA